MTDDARVSKLETFVAVQEVHNNNMDKRLLSIEDTLKWLVRLIVGAIAMAIAAYALNGGFVLA